MKRFVATVVMFVFISAAVSTTTAAGRSTLRIGEVLPLPYENGSVTVVVARGINTCQITLLVIVDGEKTSDTQTYELSDNALLLIPRLGIRLHCQADGSVVVDH